MPLSKEVVRKDARNPRKLELVQEELRKFGSRCFSSSEAPRWISRLWFQTVCRTLPALPAAKVWVIKSTRIFCSLQERKSPRHVRASVHARTALFVRVKPPCSQRTACPSNLCPFITKFFGGISCRQLCTPRTYAPHGGNLTISTFSCHVWFHSLTTSLYPFVTRLPKITHTVLFSLTEPHGILIHIIIRKIKCLFTVCGVCGWMTSLLYIAPNGVHYCKCCCIL